MLTGRDRVHVPMVSRRSRKKIRRGAVPLQGMFKHPENATHPRASLTADYLIWLDRSVLLRRSSGRSEN